VFLLLLVAWLVFFIFTYVRFCLGIQTVVLERLSPVAALRRSMRLTHGSFWRIVLFYIVIALVSGILSGVLTQLTGLVAGAAPLATRTAIEVLADGVVQIFTSPFILILLTLLYYDIRIRREAFDIEMLAQSI
jgi:amino acid permease